MPLLVVPLAAAEAGSLTLREWDELRARDPVVFEDPAHPLIDRLRAAGVRAGPFDDEPDPRRDSSALVCEPASPRVAELAHAGARVLVPAEVPDDLTAAHGAPVLRRAAAAVGGAVAVMARLRGPDGCPWDREQTHESLRVHLLEEAHEVADAIDRGLIGDELAEELGDLLLQVLFHARLAEQDGRFDVAEVASRLTAKLIARHPHVFGDVEARTASEVVANWEELKRREKGRKGCHEDVPATLPSLLRAAKLQKRATAAGFDPRRARAEIESALLDPPEAAIGRLLFWTVALARSAGVDPDGALRRELVRFERSLEGPQSR